jgi:hypothetical protein
LDLGNCGIAANTLNSISKYIVRSIIIPFDVGGGPIRVIRVAGETTTFQSVIDTLGEVEGVKYDVKYVDPAVAKQMEDDARRKGDFGEAYGWSVRPLAASGNAIVIGGGVDNEKFDFKPEGVREGFERFFGN